MRGGENLQILLIRPVNRALIGADCGDPPLTPLVFVGGGRDESRLLYIVFYLFPFLCNERLVLVYVFPFQIIGDMDYCRKFGKYRKI